jgi:hypothetical protein
MAHVQQQIAADMAAFDKETGNSCGHMVNE